MTLTRCLLWATSLIHSVCMCWTIFLLPHDKLLLPPPFAVLHVVSMLILASLHALHHVGPYHAISYFTLVAVVEWTSEQVNVRTDGYIYGALSYPDDLIGPKLLDIPVIAPLAFAALAWPALVITNLILNGHPNPASITIDGNGRETLARSVSRSAICAFIHTAFSPGVEPICVEYGAMDWSRALITKPTQAAPAGPNSCPAGTFFGIPLSEFVGWWCVTFFTTLIYLRFFLAPMKTLRLLPPPPPIKCPDLRIDAAPLLLYGGFALWLIVHPIHAAAGVFTLWTMGLTVLMACHRLADAVEQDVGIVGKADDLEILLTRTRLEKNSEKDA